MSEYHLEIKQLVDYPRCRIYREFVQSLIADRSIRTNGGSGLFYYTVLSCYANFRTSYRRLGAINYMIFPGEWLLKIIVEKEEKGISGFKVSASKRDAIQELKEAALNGEFDILLVFMFDRLGRIENETPFVLEWFAQHGIEVYSIA